ncbi:MAG: arsenical pump-driving ATPase [Rhodospirillaceae bacterium]|jgi:arsenite-transporting ATPase|nr:arsenical pump-driving ATPase [Rhodospirillaceae bacterium]MBT5297740.1 arsenical pump-driving ATPase [Rhodospirillaceae bacterium]MBT5516106.1 arsenical pump-driving ATPase [Rhodospirillaceae bacterium]MBT6087258.1 arsenical pump-driving ATPase [Rhodospirillaceae bacterium]MBT6607523.1 arsenical pump-driving ATPase [Rhodospirillaceae bacterium]
MHVLDNPTPVLFFTGKGGVGKTSLSCATAVALADSGKKVLLVSTDPASNIHEVFGQDIGTDPTAIGGVDGLKAMNVDPEAAAEAYRESVVGPYRGVLPDSAIQSIEEQFAGACTVEIAAFDEFAKLLANEDVTAGFDHVVFDTAPTGHTLRLLTLPTAWTGFIDDAAAGTSCIGPLEGMKKQRALYSSAVDALANKDETTLVLVTRPDRAAVDEAARTSEELAEIGIKNQALAVNGVFKAVDAGDAVAQAMERRGGAALEDLPAALAGLSRHDLPLKSGQVLGVSALRALLANNELEPAEHVDMVALPNSLESLVDELAKQNNGVIMTMGKGGVGKTSIAAYVAVGLAKRGHKVHLSTTDPAAHVAQTVTDIPDNLEIGRIDPEVEVEKYRDEVMSTTGSKLDAAGLALLEEDLSSPCTEEIAVFRAFARTVHEATDSIVVMDTAPTGHTILLLDAAESYHREVGRLTDGVPEAVANLLPRLRDPDFTRVLICTVPEATPVHEAADLQRDLQRAGMDPSAWVINMSLAPLSVTDPILVARKGQEARYIAEVVNEHAKQAVLVPWREDSVWGMSDASASDAA